MILKSELRASINEALVESAEEALDDKSRADVLEALLDRLAQDFDVTDDEEDAEEEEEEQSE